MLVWEAWKLGNLEVWRLGGLEGGKTGGLEAGRLRSLGEGFKRGVRGVKGASQEPIERGLEIQEASNYET